jgi:hypothetical protein
MPDQVDRRTSGHIPCSTYESDTMDDILNEKLGDALENTVIGRLGTGHNSWASKHSFSPNRRAKWWEALDELMTSHGATGTLATEQGQSERFLAPSVAHNIVFPDNTTQSEERTDGSTLSESAQRVSSTLQEILEPLKQNSVTMSTLAEMLTDLSEEHEHFKSVTLEVEDRKIYLEREDYVGPLPGLITHLWVDYAAASGDSQVTEAKAEV